MADWYALKATREACLGCPAKEGKLVPPSIRPGAGLLFVGERPGDTEARDGEVFVGRAGGTLDMLLAKSGSHRSQISIANACACYLKGNPEPSPEELERCAGMLE